VAETLSPEAWQRLNYEFKRLRQIELEQAETVTLLSQAVQPYYSGLDRLRQSGIQTHDCERHQVLLPDNSNYHVLGKCYVTAGPTTMLRKDLLGSADSSP
jgi:hypothetical protein